MNQLQHTQQIAAQQLHPRFRSAITVIAMATLGLIAPHIVQGQSTTVLPPVYHPSWL